MIGIIAILAAIVIVAINPTRQLAQGRNAARRSAANAILKAIGQFAIENGTVPSGIDSTLRMIGTDATGCSVSCGSEVGPSIPVTTQTALSSDDAEQRLDFGIVNVVSSDLELIHDDSLGDQIVGLRFPNVTVPQGAIVSNAIITFVADDEASSGPISLTIRGEASDNAVAFVNLDDNISSRMQTAASVSWSGIMDWLIEDETHATPNLSTIIQEIVDRPGWTAGNALAILIGGTGQRIAKSFDYSTPTPTILSFSYQIMNTSAESCLDLGPMLAGPYLPSLPTDPSLGSAGKTYYAVRAVNANRILVRACRAELNESIEVEQ